jgi:hypothetical protein
MGKENELDIRWMMKKPTLEDYKLLHENSLLYPEDHEYEFLDAMINFRAFQLDSILYVWYNMGEGEKTIVKPIYILPYASEKDNLELKKVVAQQTILEVERGWLNEIYNEVQRMIEHIYIKMCRKCCVLIYVETFISVWCVGGVG